MVHPVGLDTCVMSEKFQAGFCGNPQGTGLGAEFVWQFLCPSQKKSAGDLGESPAGLSVSFSGGLGGFVLQDFCQPSPYRA